jgi:hypothetical protein
MKITPMFKLKGNDRKKGISMKIGNYEEYLRNDNILSFEEAAEIMDSIIPSTGSNTPEVGELIKAMVCCAIDYAGIRARWGLLSTIEMARMNQTRSQYHDLFIQAIDNLAGYLMENRTKIEWRELLGDDRKRIGDFACYISYIKGIDSR